MKPIYEAFVFPVIRVADKQRRALYVSFITLLRYCCLVRIFQDPAIRATHTRTKATRQN